MGPGTKVVMPAFVARAFSVALFLLITMTMMAPTEAAKPITKELPAGFRRLSLVKWRAPAPVNLLASDIRQADVFGHNLVVVSHSNSVVCLDVRTGQPKWTKEHDGRYPSIPFVGQSIVLIQELDWHDGSVTRTTALDLATGNELWSKGNWNEESAPVLFRDLVYTTSKDRLKCFSSREGEKKWEREIAGVSLSRDGVLEKDLVIGLASNGVARIDGTTGETKWNVEFRSRPTGIWVVQDRVYVHVEQEEHIHSLSGKDGALLWKAISPGMTIRPLVAGSNVAFLGRSRMSSHFHGLIVVNRNTGSQIWSAGGDDEVQSAALSGDFVYYQRRTSLNVFDLKRGLSCAYYDLEDPFYILQGDDSRILLVDQSSGVTSLLPNVAEMRAFHDLPFLEFGPGLLQPLFHVAVFLFAIVAIVVIGSGGKRTIPGTPDTAAQMMALCLAWVCISVVLIHSAWLVWILGNRQGFALIHASAIVSLCLPLATIPAAYLLHGLRSLRLLAGASRDNSTEPHTLSFLAELAASMEIRAPVRLLSMEPGYSPSIVWTYRGYVITVPSDFSKKALEVSKQDSMRAYQLERLIIAHELAHLKNGDLIVLPLLQASQWMWLSLCPVVLLWGWSKLASNEDLSKIILPAIALNALTSLTCWLVSLVVTRAKEKQADGLASTFVTPENLRRLTEPIGGATGFSVFHEYLFLLGIGQRGTWKFAGWDMDIKTFTAALKNRAKNIEEKREVIRLGTAVPPLLAIVAGLIAAVVAQTADAEKLLIFNHFLLNKYGAIGAYWLQEILSWNTFPGAATNSIAMAFSGLAVGSLLLIPLRDSHRDTDLLDKRIGAWVALLLITAYIVANTVLGIVSPIARHGVLNFRVLGLTDSISFLVLVAVSAGLWVTMLGRWARNLTDAVATFVEVLAGLGIIFSIWTVIIVFFDAIPVSSRFLLAVFSSLLGGIISNMGLDILAGRQKRYVAEAITYQRLLNVRRTRICFDSLKDRGQSMCRAILSSSFSEALPLLLIALVVYPPLISLDQWYTNSAGSLIDGVHRATDLPMEEIIRRGIGIWKDCWFGLLMTQTGAHGKLAASGLVLLLASTGVLAMQALALFLRLFFQSESKRQELIATIPLLATLSEQVNRQLISQLVFAKYTAAIHKGFQKRTPFVKGVEGLPLMAATCEATLIDQSLTPEELSWTLNWIHSCAARNGGFGRAPGQDPDVLHTYAGLRALTKRRLLAQEELDMHSAWLVEQAKRIIQQGEKQNTIEGLSHVYYIVRALSLMSSDQALDTETTKAMRQMCITLWQNGRKDEDVTFLAAEALTGLGVTEADLPTDIRKRIAGFEGKLNQMDPGHDLRRVSMVIGMISVAFPQDFLKREKICVAIDNIEKTYNRPGLLAALSNWIAARKR